MAKQTERIVNADRVEDLIAVFGSFDENIKRIEHALNVQVVNRGTDLRVSGDEEMVDKAVRTIEGLLTLASKGEVIDEQRVRYLITLVNEGNDQQVAQMTVVTAAELFTYLFASHSRWLCRQQLNDSKIRFWIPEKRSKQPSVFLL